MHRLKHFLNGGVPQGSLSGSPQFTLCVIHRPLHGRYICTVAVSVWACVTDVVCKSMCLYNHTVGIHLPTVDKNKEGESINLDLRLRFGIRLALGKLWFCNSSGND